MWGWGSMGPLPKIRWLVIIHLWENEMLKPTMIVYTATFPKDSQLIITGGSRPLIMNLWLA